MNEGFVNWETEEARKLRLLRAVVERAKNCRGWYGLPLIYRQEYQALIAALNALEGEVSNV